MIDVIEHEGSPLWMMEQAECEWCGHRYLSVHPTAYKLECPKCSLFSMADWAKENDGWLEKNVG